MSLDCEILEMKVGEKVSLEFEHSSYLATGDSLTGVPIVTEDSSNSITSVGSPTISGTKVVVIVTAISSGKSVITCTVNTTLGSLSIEEQKVFVI